MDIFAHSLWTNAVYYKKYRYDLKNRLWAVFFGVAPDLVSFAPAFFYLIFSRSRLGIESFNSGLWVFRYAAESYNFTHSMVIFVLAMIVVTVLRKGRQYWPMWGWALHIGIDIFSHKGFYETPFLFPLSGYRFDHGYSWGHPTFMFFNYGALAIIYIVIFYFQKSRNAKKA